LNRGWRDGLPPKILNIHARRIEKMSKVIDAKEEKLEGLSSVANVRYFLGDERRAYQLAKQDWYDAESGDSILKWIVAYAYFYTTALYLCDFRGAMKDVADRWYDHHHDELAPEQQEVEIDQRYKDDRLTLNPILGAPRHLILYAAFAGSPADGDPWPIDNERYWPSTEHFETHKHEDAREKELNWVETWYNTGIDLCDEYGARGISRNFTHACAGFYFTLLREGPRAQEDFDRLDTSGTSFVVSRYAGLGFRGIIYKLVAEKTQKRRLQILGKLRDIRK
jgi:hypothetical protein